MVTPVARREATAHLRQVWAVSEQRACKAIGADRSSVRYCSRRRDDGAVRVRLRELAASRRRFGYRRLHVLLRREGIALNHKKLRRLYAEERLQVRRRGGRKRALGTRAPLAIPQGPDQRWSLDFAFCRTYEDGKPADTSAHWLRLARDGAADGDPVFVAGHPAATDRLQTVAQLEYLRDARHPRIRQLIDNRLRIMRTPTTLPASLAMPAMARWEPLGLPT